ncbi:MAG: glutamate--tRNA ligase [Saprospiraceae bacterium]
MQNIRLRFAPSPTGALHIGGVRTALYNYLLAKKHGGTFILRIEDTDQTRYVPGAEDYILEALNWCGLTPDEGPGIGGDFGPYRQSERKDLYGKYAQQLINNGKAYYAFDTPEELTAKREAEKANGNHTFKYDAAMRSQMRNSESLSAAEVKTLLDANTPYVIRLKVPQDEEVKIQDLVRGEVVFQSNELDDKVLLKTDGMPTYHMANIVDDHLMEITHVIRGEEWLPSTAHHVLLYRAFGWEATMPQFAHLPLILKPNGKGKLSKRDGAKLGIPVFPLSWKGETEADSFDGFRNFGFLPAAVNNFLAFLGWNPGTEQEMFSMEELTEAFSVEKIGKSGARFDFDKAKWFNQQYIIATPNDELANMIRPAMDVKGYEVSDAELADYCGMFKERVTFLTDLPEVGYYIFEEVKAYDEKTIRKRWKPDRQAQFDRLLFVLNDIKDFTEANIETAVKAFMEETGLKFGDVLPIMRVALSGTLKGPSIFAIAEILGQQKVISRMKDGYVAFNEIKARQSA